MKCKNCDNLKVHCKGLCKKCYNEEYRARPDVKEKLRILSKTYYENPEHKQHQKEYNQRPENKQRQKEYNQRPDVKAKRREYMQRPDVKAKQKIRMKEYFKKPEVKAKQKIYQKIDTVRLRLNRLEHKYIEEVRPLHVQREIDMLKEMIGEYYEL